jgi:hypothetical protein
MNNMVLGIVCGLVFGVVVVLLMLPLPFEDKRRALLGAFASRFAVGFVIAISVLPIPGWLKGSLLGFLLSLPDAIITKSYAPILIIGTIGGAVIGLITGRWGTP